MGKLAFHALLSSMAIVLALIAPVASERLAGPAAANGPRASVWRSLGPGAEYAAIALSPKPVIGDGLLHVVRVDPSQATLRVRMAAQLDGRPRTAREWCDNPRIVAVINAGMYDRDLSTHIGFLRVGDRVGSARWVSRYNSILLLGARRPHLPAATIRDLPSDGRAADFADYDTVVQNLRLIRDPAVNVWAQSDRRWSEAAIALDRRGRILFLLCRSPFTMHDFNALVTALPLGVTRAMHVEGGSEASLSVRGPGIEVDLSGSYETGFNPSDDSKRQWPLPNVVTVEAGSPRGKVR
jgi:hypothetical protein